MAIITYTREARCSDCNNLKYFYKGKRKYHFCSMKKEQRKLSSSAVPCVNENIFSLNYVGIPDEL